MSDWQEFVASLVGSLAWPTAVIALAWIFRSALRSLLSGDVRRWKAGPAGLEVEYWEKTIAASFQELAQDSSKALAAARSGEAARGGFVDEMLELASVSPRSAVLESYCRIELRLKSILEDAELMPTRPTGARIMAETALKNDLATAGTVDAIRKMSTLRNLAAHGHDDGDIDQEQALEFINLASAVLSALDLTSRH